MLVQASSSFSEDLLKDLASMRSFNSNQLLLVSRLSRLQEAQQASRDQKWELHIQTLFTTTSSTFSADKMTITINLEIYGHLTSTLSSGMRLVMMKTDSDPLHAVATQQLYGVRRCTSLEESSSSPKSWMIWSSLTSLKINMWVEKIQTKAAKDQSHSTQDRMNRESTKNSPHQPALKRDWALPSERTWWEQLILQVWKKEVPWNHRQK